jgi:hypothetical protein
LPLHRLIAVVKSETWQPQTTVLMHSDLSSVSLNLIALG